jgi:hypothetical protein
MSLLTSSSSNHDIIVDTFTLFPELPPELRIKVWKFAAQKPQVISIYKVWALDLVKAQPTKPGTLLANKESRQVALEERPLCFKDQLMQLVHCSSRHDIIDFTSEAAFSNFMNASKTSPLLSHLMVHRISHQNYPITPLQSLNQLSKLQTLRLEPPSWKRHNHGANLADKNRLENYCSKRGIELQWMTRVKIEKLAKDFR